MSIAIRIGGLAVGSSGSNPWRSRYYILKSGTFRYKREINRAAGYFTLWYSEDSGVTWESLMTLDLTEPAVIIDLAHVYRHRIVDGDYRVDNTLTSTGYTGVEGVDWENLYTSKPYDTEEYGAVLAAKDTPPSGMDQFNERKWLSKMIDGGYYAKAELLDMFSADTSANSLINWKSPGTFDPELVNTPVFVPYEGFQGIPGSNSNVRLHFIPGTDATIMSQNNTCLMIGIGTDHDYSSNDVGVMDGTRLEIMSRMVSGKAYFRANDVGANNIDDDNSIKWYVMSRGTAANFDVYMNKVKTNIVQASAVLPDLEMYACGVNEDGSISTNYKKIRFAFLFSYLTETEVNDVIDITEEYLLNYHTNLINYDNYIAKPYAATKAIVPLTTYEGSGETVHPSVVDFGSAWNGYRYWMGNVPYYLNNNLVERPSIWGSNDGETWVVPPGVTNPIHDVANNGDPNLIFDNNILYYMFGSAVGVYEKHSSNGVAWSDPVLIATPIVGEDEIDAPSAIKIGNRYYIYYTTFTNVPNNPRVLRISCDTIDGTYGDRETVNVPWIDGFIWWHIGIMFYNGYYYLVANQSTGGHGPAIFVMKSSDGINFVKSPYPTVYLNTVTGVVRGFYRPCLTTINNQPTIYYGMLDNETHWYCYKIDVDLL